MLAPKLTPKLKKVGELFILNVFNRSISKRSRRSSLNNVTTLKSLTETFAHLYAMFEKAIKVRGVNGSKDCFFNARNEAFNLQNVDLDTIYLSAQQSASAGARGLAVKAQQDLVACFTELLNVIRTHASLEFNLQENDTTSTLGQRVGYRLGSRVLSLAEVQDVAVNGRSPFTLGRDTPLE